MVSVAWLGTAYRYGWWVDRGLEIRACGPQWESTSLSRAQFSTWDGEME